MQSLRKTIGALVPKSKAQNITYNIDIPEKITSPVYEGQILRRS